MKTTTPQPFEIRAYGRTELARRYCPHLRPQSAWQRLKGWIMNNPRLRDALTDYGVMPSVRTFTRHQVELIVSELGQPE